MDTKNITIEKTFAQAIQNHQKNNFKAAEELYKQILKINPLHFETVFRLGMLSAQTKDFERAQQLLNRALQMDPKHTDAHNTLGSVQYDLGDYKRAMLYYQKVIQIDPNHAVAYNNIGNVLLKLGEYQKAIFHYQKAIQIQPRYADAHNNLGSILMMSGKYEKAIQTFQKIIQTHPNYVAAHNNLGTVLIELREYKKAMTYFQKAIEINPNYAPGYSNLGIVYKELKEFQKSKNTHQQAIKLNPNSAEPYNNLGNTLREMGQYMEALVCYQKSILINPNYEKAIFNLANLLKITLVGNLTQANSASLKESMLFLFRRNDIDHRAIFENAKLLLMVKKNIDQENFRDARFSLLSEEKDDTPSQINKSNSVLLKNKAIQDLLKEELFLLILKKTLMADNLLEKIITALRYEILFTFVDSKKNILRENFEFIVSVAEQCFLNEYVYFQSKKEDDYVSKLKKEIENSKEINELGIAILGCYVPLYSLENIVNKLFNYQSKNISFNDLMTAQIKEPLKEKEISSSIKLFGKISDDISKKVRDQYEEHPYPRWRYAPTNLKTHFLSQLNHEIQPNVIEINNKFNIPKVLVAGCGTGRHIFIVKNYLNANILGVDLSLTSLAYAKRKTEELGLKNIEFLQADILQLNNLDRKFDVIECVGVLHHLKDPLAGLKVLLDLLEPHGLLKLGLYSEIARRHIIKAREFIKKNKFNNTIKDIRNCRRMIINEKEEQLLQHISKGSDFYSISSVRDLMFHVQEHRFTLPQISKILINLNLEFLGFADDTYIKKTRFSELFPNDKNNVSLDNWNQFEIDNPTAFRSMYNFWVRKKH